MSTKINKSHTSKCITCMVSEGIMDMEKIALANSGNTLEAESFAFDHITAEYGTDNCATHHVCDQRELFTEMGEPLTPIGIRGVTRTTNASGVGTVQFKLKDDDGKQHNIILKDVIFLPNAAKNLISIAQWSTDKA